MNRKDHQNLNCDRPFPERLLNPASKPAHKAVLPHHFRFQAAHHTQIEDKKQRINEKTDGP